MASATQRTQGLFWDGVQGAHWVRTIPVALALGCYPSLDALAACGDANLTVRRVEQGIQVHLTGIHVGGRAAAPERSLAPCGGVGEANDVFNVSTPPCLCQWRLMMERLASSVTCQCCKPPAGRPQRWWAWSPCAHNAPEPHACAP